jgi:predicted PurR-regulated permease PerM
MGEHRALTSVPTWAIWIGLIALALFLYLVRSVLAPFVVGGFIAYVLSPVVGTIQERWNLPRALAIATVYLAILGPIALLIVLFGPRFLAESRLLVLQAPTILTTLIEDLFGVGPYDFFGTTLDARQVVFGIVGSIRETFGTTAAAIRLVADLSDFFLKAFLTLIVSIYLLGDEMRVGSVLLSWFPQDRRETIVDVSEDVHRTLARYFRRQLVLIAFVATVTFIGLEFVFHLHYALPLAVFTGVVEIVPFLGPVTAGTVAALVAISQGGVGLLIGVVVFYVLLRQVEDQVVMPVVLGHAVELHPLIIIFAVLAGGALFGLLGTLAAVPVAASIKVIFDSIPKLLNRSATKDPSTVAETFEQVPRL